MSKYGSLLNTLVAVAMSAVGVAVVQAGGDWGLALDTLAVTVLTAVIKVLNPADKDVGINSKKD